MKAESKVAAFIEELAHPLKAEVASLREIILAADPEITEQIKWNAPSFCYDGDDRITMNLHSQDRIRLIFHRGAKVKDATEFRFEDSSDLLEWTTKDRAIAVFADQAAIDANRAKLADLTKRWMHATS